MNPDLIEVILAGGVTFILMMFFVWYFREGLRRVGLLPSKQRGTNNG